MTSNGTSPKRWRPRFSLRTLAIFVTLVCCYFGAWEATKRWGVTRTTEQTYLGGRPPFRFVDIIEAHSPLPFVVVRNEIDSRGNEDRMGLGLTGNETKRYYLWLLGPKVKLFEQEK